MLRLLEADNNELEASTASAAAFGSASSDDNVLHGDVLVTAGHHLWLSMRLLPTMQAEVGINMKIGHASAFSTQMKSLGNLVSVLVVFKTKDDRTENQGKTKKYGALRAPQRH